MRTRVWRLSEVDPRFRGVTSLDLEVLFGAVIPAKAESTSFHTDFQYDPVLLESREGVET